LTVYDFQSLLFQEVYTRFASSKSLTSHRPV
jgi:hypothetical protein